MAANRQSNLTEEQDYNEKLLRFMNSVAVPITSNTVQMGATQGGSIPSFIYPGHTGVSYPSALPLPVEIREEKWVVLYKCAPDKFDWNNVEGVILKDKESGAEVKMTIKDLCIAAGLTW